MRGRCFPAYRWHRHGRRGGCNPRPAQPGWRSRDARLRWACDRTHRHWRCQPRAVRHSVRADGRPGTNPRRRTCHGIDRQRDAVPIPAVSAVLAGAGWWWFGPETAMPVQAKAPPPLPATARRCRPAKVSICPAYHCPRWLPDVRVARYHVCIRDFTNCLGTAVIGQRQ